MTQHAFFSALTLTTLLSACSATSPESDSREEANDRDLDSEGDGGDSTGGGGFDTGDGDLTLGGDGDGDESTAYSLPSGYTPGQLGGWLLGDEITAETSGSTSDCGDEVVGVVRDFKRGDPGQNGHPDFQTFFGSEASTGLIENTLVNQKPVYSGLGELGAPPQKQMTSQARFDEWYASDSTGTVNRTYEIRFSLEPNGDVRTFQSSAFYPLNGEGFGSEEPFVVNAGLPDEQSFAEQNFHFTTEVHTKFRYEGGEVFSFSGDDDLWVFINNELVLDLGGLHPELAGSVDMDGLGLSVGNEYTLDLFHAERGMPESNFRIDTSLEFIECIIVR